MLFTTYYDNNSIICIGSAATHVLFFQLLKRFLEEVDVCVQET